MTKSIALKRIMTLSIELDKVDGFKASVVVTEMELVLQEYSDNQNASLIQENEELKNDLKIAGDLWTESLAQKALKNNTISELQEVVRMQAERIEELKRKK